jgi:hypothetical protein
MYKIGCLIYVSTGMALVLEVCVVSSLVASFGIVSYGSRSVSYFEILRRIYILYSCLLFFPFVSLLQFVYIYVCVSFIFMHIVYKNVKKRIKILNIGYLQTLNEFATSLYRH